jgi:hypothetical protein
VDSRNGLPVAPSRKAPIAQDGRVHNHNPATLHPNSRLNLGSE